MNNDILPTSEGILRCLQAIAEETASVGLIRTYLALQQAISLCSMEMGVSHPSAPANCLELVH